MRRQSVSITLENCYDDWTLAQIAKILGKEKDYEYFIKRAHNYQNVFDSRTGFMRPKTADGQWIEPFDPIWSGGQGGRDYYTENVSAQNKYIQTARLNNKTLDKPWFKHSDLVKGGILLLNMGPRPNKQWGSAPEAAPPSMTEFKY